MELDTVRLDAVTHLRKIGYSPENISKFLKSYDVLKRKKLRPKKAYAIKLFTDIWAIVKRQKNIEILYNAHVPEEIDIIRDYTNYH